MVSAFPFRVGVRAWLRGPRRVTLSSMKGLIGRPILLEKMDAELVPKVVQAIIDDNERAKRAKEKRRRRRKDRGRRRSDGEA